MFLKEITLTNFKCHTHLWLSFACEKPAQPVRKTTFLLGENGTGKSALLKAVALITSGSNGLSDVLGNPDDWIQNKKKICEVSAVIVTAIGEERHISLKITRGHSLRQIISENAATLEQIDDAISKADRNYFVVAYGASRRLNHGEFAFYKGNSYSSKRSQCIQTLFNTDAPLVSLANWAMDLDYTTKSSGLTVIKNALNKFFISNVRFKGIDKVKRTLIFNTPDGPVTLEQLSDGYQNVTGWIGDLIYNITTTFPDYKIPLHARGLLLIDEIDLHLHPRWQRQLHQFLKDRLPNFQIIATTHSPLTAQQAEENELYALSRENKTIQLIPFKGDPSKMLLHQVLSSPVFGLSSDESLKVENAKEEIRNLVVKESITPEEQRTIASNAGFLKSLPMNNRKHDLVTKEDLSLLQEINAHFQKKTRQKTKFVKRVKAAVKAKQRK